MAAVHVHMFVRVYRLYLFLGLGMGLGGAPCTDSSRNDYYDLTRALYPGYLFYVCIRDTAFFPRRPRFLLFPRLSQWTSENIDTELDSIIGPTVHLYGAPPRRTRPQTCGQSDFFSSVPSSHPLASSRIRGTLPGTSDVMGNVGSMMVMAQLAGSRRRPMRSPRVNCNTHNRPHPTGAPSPSPPFRPPASTPERLRIRERERRQRPFTDCLFRASEQRGPLRARVAQPCFSFLSPRARPRDRTRYAGTMNTNGQGRN